MDSVTQVALGSAVGVAVMGRRVGIWKSALWGGFCGTLPDLDVLIDHGDPISNMTLHRTESHALFYLTLVSPLLAWLIHRIHGDGARLGRWWFATWLALTTHPLLDWLTIYGTQLGLPFTDHPFAVGSIFVIDPVYTLALIAGLAAAFVAARRRPGGGRRWNLLGIAVSSGYLAWSVLAQAHVTTIAEASLRGQGLSSERLLVVPTPFNTVLWRVLTVDGDSYLEGFHSLLDPDDDIVFERHPRGLDLFRQHQGDWYVDRVAWFSHGFFRMRSEDGAVQISDLRMGQEPTYTFTFKLPAASSAGPVLVPQQIDIGRSIAWLWRRMLGEQPPFRG